MKPEGLLATIAEQALERKLPFLLAGGHAVVLHGVARNTFDLDLIVARDHRGAWLDLFTQLGYEIFHETPTFLQLTTPDQKKIPVDLLLVNTDTLQKLLADAGPAPLETSGAKVVSLLHLLGLKCHAVKFGHRGRIEKDVDDIIALIRINRLDLRQSEVRAMILEHGTHELYEKLLRASQP
jgi:hypothetical protein